MTAPQQNQSGENPEQQGQEQPEELQTYTYTQFGNEVTGQLTKEDAEKLGAKPVNEQGGGGERRLRGGDEQRGSKLRKQPPDNK